MASICLFLLDEHVIQMKIQSIGVVVIYLSDACLYKQTYKANKQYDMYMIVCMDMFIHDTQPYEI